MSKPNFVVEIKVDGAWRKVRRVKSKGESGGLLVRVLQRDAQSEDPEALAESCIVQCYAGYKGELTTTVDMNGATRFKKKTRR